MQSARGPIALTAIARRPRLCNDAALPGRRIAGGRAHSRDHGVASPSTFFDTAHFLARCMRYRLHTEKLEIKTLMQLNLEGASALDVGANNGIYCFWMLRAVGPAGRVVAFEPQPEMAEAIRQKQARFDWANLHVINVALSDAEGKLNLARDRIGDGSASLEASRHRAGQDTIDVPVTRLDALPSDLLGNVR